MPHKTKKQKIIAAYRKKLQQLHLASSQPKGFKAPTARPPASGDNLYQNTEDDSRLKQWITKELRKIMITTGFIIVLEFLIFYAKLKGIYHF